MVIKNKGRILVIKSCSPDCPHFEAYEDQGWGDRDSRDWCKKKQKNIDRSDDAFPKFCPLEINNA